MLIHHPLLLVVLLLMQVYAIRPAGTIPIMTDLAARYLILGLAVELPSKILQYLLLSFY
jgi:hypothetical protein